MNILGHDYKVKIVRELERDTGNLGCCSLRKDSIHIDGGMSTSFQEATLFHEIFEAIIFLNEIEMPHNMVTILAQNWYGVMKSNGFLVKDVLKKL